MSNIVNYPFLIFVLSFFALWLSARISASLRDKQPKLEEDVRDDLNVVVAATLTLLGLIIGFTFSMAMSRYDQRKTYEEAEANAIGTEYLRTDLLPGANAAKIRELLKEYLDQRVLFYQSRDEAERQRINSDTSRLQTELWSALAVQSEQPSPMIALAVSGMNDVLNSQGYTQAAWWNRIPIAAWGLMAAVAIYSNMLVGYSRRRTKAGILQFLLFPLVLSIAFTFIADIDSPRRGIIRVHPQNLISLAQSLHTH
jgi:hypothetical protein